MSVADDGAGPIPTFEVVCSTDDDPVAATTSPGKRRPEAAELPPKKQRQGTKPFARGTLPFGPPPPPTVVRMKRSHGRVVQDCDVYIGRRWTVGGWDLPQSPWANPFTVKECGSVGRAVARFREYILNKPELLSRIHELGGKRLGCWCKPGPCHGDVLVSLYKESTVRSCSDGAGGTDP